MFSLLSPHLVSSFGKRQLSCRYVEYHSLSDVCPTNVARYKYIKLKTQQQIRCLSILAFSAVPRANFKIYRLYDYVSICSSSAAEPQPHPCPMILYLEGLRRCAVKCKEALRYTHLLDSLSPSFGLIYAMSISGLPLVIAYTAAIQNLLQKPQYSIQHAVTEPTPSTTWSEKDVQAIVNIGENGSSTNHQAHFAAIETAFRDLFYELLVRRCDLYTFLPG